jgi:DNA polymerase-3 subunit gamma/tau
VDVSTVQRYWPDIIEAVKQKSRATWMVIMSGVRPAALEGRVLTLAFDAEGNRLGFVNGNRDVILSEVLRERMGVDWRIETVSGGAGGGRGQAGPGPNAGPGGGGRSGASGGPGGGFGSSGGFGSAPSGGFGSSSTGGAPSSGGFGSSSAAPSGFGGGTGQSGPQQGGPPPNAVPRPAPGENGTNGARRGNAFGAGGSAAGDPGPLPPPPDEPPPPPEPSPVDESDEVDPEGDADADGTEAEMSGMALIQRELGGQIIREIDNS